MLSSIFRRDPFRTEAERLYLAVANQSRQPVFYRELGIPDTVDGRFDLLVLHAFLVMERLKAHPQGVAINQSLFDAMFRHLDLAVREMGVQDLGVGRRIKIMAEGFHGRVTSLAEALQGQDDAALREALTRNVFGRAAPSEAALDRLVRYTRQAVAALENLPVEKLFGGEVVYPAL